MAEFVDRNGVMRRIEFSPSYIKGWVKLTIFSPKSRDHGQTWEVPSLAIDELITNLTKLKE